MGNFRQGNNKGGSYSRGSGSRSFGGGRSGNRSFGGDRGGSRGGFGRGQLEMFDAVCSKCGNECQVPFRPTGSKPVFCSNCFRKEDGAGVGNNSGSFRKERPSSFDGASGAGVSAEQFNQINAKLDKILTVLQSLEIIEEDSEEEGDMDEGEEDSQDDK